MPDGSLYVHRILPVGEPRRHAPVPQIVSVERVANRPTDALLLEGEWSGEFS